MNQVIVQSLLAGLATVLGALIALAWGRPGPRPTALLLGFAAGVMLLVVSLDLLPHALKAGRVAAALGVCLGVLGCKVSGSIAYRLVRRSSQLYGHRQAFFRMGLMVALSIALHDLPEGLAIGAGFAESGAIGTSLAIAIGLHNIPEGIGVAIPLNHAGSSKARIVLLCLAISLVTPFGAILGAAVSTVNPWFIGFLLAFAAGAMLFVVTDEIIPASNRLSRAYSLLGITAGAMMVLLWL